MAESKTEFGGSEVLFVGKGGALTSSWYRCALPARFLGAGWANITRDPPPDFKMTAGWSLQMPALDDMVVVILQQVYGEAWAIEIERLREAGVKVLYEVDDNLHAVAAMEDHPAHEFWKRTIEDHEDCMRVCDGIICSTDWLARRYSEFGRTFVCPNGIDVQRYSVTIPTDRPTINIGWAGGVGHKEAAMPWLHEIRQLLELHKELRFVSIGEPLANELADDFPDQVLAVPFATIENFPAAMTNFDLAIAPALDNDFFFGKSDLRFLESAAMRLPLVASEITYPEIDDGITGFKVSGPDEAGMVIEMLINTPEVRQQVGQRAREYVEQKRQMEVAIQPWIDVLETIT